MALKYNYSYFGPSVMHTQFDLSQMVYELEGTRRNLPQVQFEIPRPLGTRYFVTFRNGFDPPASYEASDTSPPQPGITEFRFDSTIVTFDSTTATFDRT